MAERESDFTCEALGVVEDAGAVSNARLDGVIVGDGSQAYATGSLTSGKIKGRCGTPLEKGVHQRG